LQPKTRFEVYMVQTLEKIVNGEPYDRETWETRMQVYMQLISAGVYPEIARATMDMYLD